MLRHCISMVALLIAGTANAQSVRYWPQLEIGFPVPASAFDGSQKPVKFRLYASSGNGRFERVSELAADRLQPIPNRRPGFVYNARGDGEEEFALQAVFADGSVSPEERDLRGDRVVFDTRPPAISIQPLGTYGVQWNVTDDNPESSGLRLECRWVGDARWHNVAGNKPFALRDEYTWASLARETRTLEVRVIAKDKAGHESVSKTIRLPDNGNNRREAFPAAGANEPIRNLDEIPNSASQIVYVNRRDMTIRTKLTHVTRSGVAKIHLYVKELSGTGGEWKFDKSQDCNIKYDSADTTIEIPYVAPKDGRYGFIVIPESGVGRREPEPRASAPPQHLVEVDTVKPNVKVRTVTVTPGGGLGPRVEIEWDADDRNLMPDPIVLEYAADRNGANWISIAEKIPNSRRYVWEVADKTMFKLYIRARATDKATNVGEHVYDQVVVIDLDKPSATIDAIRGTGGLPPANLEKPAAPPPLGNTVPLPNINPGKVPDLLPPPGK